MVSRKVLEGENVEDGRSSIVTGPTWHQIRPAHVVYFQYGVRYVMRLPDMYVFNFSLTSLQGEGIYLVDRATDMALWNRTHDGAYPSPPHAARLIPFDPWLPELRRDIEMSIQEQLQTEGLVR